MGDFSDPPTVTVVIAAHNEEGRIAARLENIFACDYPREKLSVIVVSDGSTDATNQKVLSFGNNKVRLLEKSSRQGKASCLNVALAAAGTDLIVFADCRQRFAPETLRALVSPFADRSVGAVSGELRIDSSASNTGSGVDAYWKLEKFIRHRESLFDSCIGCTGAVYAIRRELFEPIPSDTILDDVVIPMRVAMRGCRVLFEPRAVAYDPQTLEPEREKIRKQRTLAGNYQMLIRYPHWLLFWKNRLWWQLLSHKYLRLVAPFFLALLLLSNIGLLHIVFYQFTLGLQSLFYLFAVVGTAFRRIRLPILSLPAGFVFLNVMTIRGLLYFLRQKGQGSWQIAGR